MNSIYIESDKILPRKDIVEWLDGCGAKWASGESFSHVAMTKFIQFTTNLTGEFRLFHGRLNNATHCQTPEQFCELIAESLGIDKPVFGQVGISKTETTTDHIPYVGKKVDEQDKLFPGRNNTMGEGSLTQEDIHTLLGDKVSPSYKTYRILDSLDGIPLDTRIPLSEWIPPFLRRVLFIKNNEFKTVHFCNIEKNGLIVFDGVSNLILSDLDGHWMRIV